MNFTQFQFDVRATSYLNTTYMGVTGVSQPRRTSRTLTLPSPAASHRLAAPAQGEEPANQATATATEASAARAHRNAGLRAERREGDNVLAWAE
jgi:hypothetical protein